MLTLAASTTESDGHRVKDRPSPLALRVEPPGAGPASSAAIRRVRGARASDDVRSDSPARGERLLDRERGRGIGGRDLPPRPACPCHMRVIDLPHAWHYATPSHVRPGHRGTERLARPRAPVGAAPPEAGRSPAAGEVRRRPGQSRTCRGPAARRARDGRAGRHHSLHTAGLRLPRRRTSPHGARSAGGLVRGETSGADSRLP